MFPVRKQGGPLRLLRKNAGERTSEEGGDRLLQCCRKRRGKLLFWEDRSPAADEPGRREVRLRCYRLWGARKWVRHSAAADAQRRRRGAATESHLGTGLGVAGLLRTLRGGTETRCRRWATATGLLVHYCGADLLRKTGGSLYSRRTSAVNGSVKWKPTAMCSEVEAGCDQRGRLVQEGMRLCQRENVVATGGDSIASSGWWASAFFFGCNFGYCSDGRLCIKYAPLAKSVDAELLLPPLQQVDATSRVGTSAAEAALQRLKPEKILITNFYHGHLLFPPPFAAIAGGGRGWLDWMKQELQGRHRCLKQLDASDPLKVSRMRRNEGKERFLRSR
ncbi:hypothetical protein MLD38_034936 [Melastoma candidum]|uniref:Uncharacterized protein n=1 Tax=Melastoma candidum TaxID=119954 RepID=A0ACB9MEV1_9MYRT|nr:hypothetical protein MLD38_034936 [Melastoma candidum]